MTVLARGGGKGGGGDGVRVSQMYSGRILGPTGVGGEVPASVAGGCTARSYMRTVDGVQAEASGKGNIGLGGCILSFSFVLRKFFYRLY